MAEDQVTNLLEQGDTPRRGRPPRAAAERAERRRRGGGNNDTSALAVPESVSSDLAANGLEGRWINDLGNRMYNKTVLDDWDKVEGVEPVPVGVDNRTGKSIMAHYCAKPKEFLVDDNRRRMDVIAQRERAVFSGNDHGEMDEGAYNPLGTTNSVRRSA